MEFNFKTKYLQLSKKREIVNHVAKLSIYEENGMKLCDEIVKRSAIDMSIIMFYTDIELDTVDIDELYENGVLDDVFETIINEYSLIVKLVDSEINQIKESYNSIGAVINRNLEKLINIVEKNTDPKTLKSTIKELGKIDLNKMTQIKDIYNTLKAGGIQ